MSGFYNDPAQAVAAALSASCLDAGRVVATRKHPSALLGTHLLSRAAGQATTALLTGGGSGHEPFATGFVGPGLVDACVAGQVFASPTAAAIAALIRHVASAAPHLQGICLVVLNYQGDRLNFSRAVRDVRADPDPVGIPVRIVLVADDASLRHDAEPRGLAGVAFVLKVAGAAIQRGMSFVDVVRVAESASKSVWTIGVALRPATLPGSSESLSGNNRRAGDGTELGLGIHNEPGAHILPISPANAEDFVDQVVNTICELLDAAMSENLGHDHPQPKTIAILVNNLGSVSQLSMGVVLRAVSDNIFGDLAERHILTSSKFSRIYMSSGTLVTSLDMNGFSISAMIIHDDETEELLLAETPCRIWPRVFLVTRETYLAACPRDAFKYDATHGAGSGGLNVPGKKQQSIVVKCMIAVISELLKHADDLGAKDAITGDGDFGATLRAGCVALSTMVENGDMDSVDDGVTVCRVISEATGDSMGGTSGNLTSTFFEACSRAYTVSTDWRQAFIAGTDAVSSVGHAKIGDRTLMDALQPAALSRGGNAIDAAESARLGANATALLTTAKFGRSSHVSSENLMGVVDPGAEAVAIALRAYAAALRCLELGDTST